MTTEDSEDCEDAGAGESDGTTEAEATPGTGRSERSKGLVFAGLGLLIAAAVIVTLILTIGRRELLAPFYVPGGLLAARGRLAAIEQVCRRDDVLEDIAALSKPLIETGQHGRILDMLYTRTVSDGWSRLAIENCRYPETVESYELAPGRKLIWARDVPIRAPRSILADPLRSVGPDIVSEAGGIEIQTPDGTYLRILICLDR